MKKSTAGSNNTQVIEAVTKLVEPVIEDLGFELVEVQFRGEPIGLVLRLLIYREDGITIDDCARVSREVEHLLEVEDLIEHSYHLEVSSPGLDRPLKNKRDFARSRGEKVRVTVRVPLLEKLNWEGSIEDADDDTVRLATEQGKVVIPYTTIVKAKLVIEI